MTQPINRPARKTRGDLLREQMILRGEIMPDQEPASQKKFLIVSIILLLVLAAIVTFSWMRVDLIESQSLQGLELPKDAEYASFYKLAQFLGIVCGACYLFYAAIRLLAPRRRKPNISCLASQAPRWLYK